MADIRFATKTYERLDDDEFYDLICNLHWQIHERLPNSPSWMGQLMMQWPQDIIAYQELLWKLKPQLVIETGTGGGGCTFFFASVLDQMVRMGVLQEDYEIVSIDYQENEVSIVHPRVTFLKGDSESSEIIEAVRQRWNSDKTTVVFLDSAHDQAHVLKEMESYGPLVSIGSYMVVEDTWLSYSGGDTQGPLAAVRYWVQTHDGWEMDRWFERWLCSQHPCGWLKRVK